MSIILQLYVVSVNKKKQMKFEVHRSLIPESSRDTTSRRQDDGGRRRFNHGITFQFRRIYIRNGYFIPPILYVASFFGT